MYIMASKYNGTIYVGVTNDLIRRAYEHKHKIIKGFTAQHDVDKLVYCEEHDSYEQAAIGISLSKSYSFDLGITHK